MRKLILLLLLLGAAAGGGYWYTYLRPAAETAEAPRRGPRRGPDSTPVFVATAEQRDVPIFLDGLGSAQASAQVTIKPMVDGPLLEIRFREGQDVRAGDVLAQIDPRTYRAQYDQARAKKQQTEANLANARVDAARYAKLAASAYSSAQQADTARAQVAQLEGQLASDQAQIDNAATLLSFTTIKAPIDGRIGMRLVDPGNIVRASDPAGLLVITTLQPLNVVFTLPQQELPALAAAMAEGMPEVIALPQEYGPAALRQPLDRGRLTVMDNQVDAATGTIKLKASFPNEKLQLWPGAFVTVRVQVRTWKSATTVPPVAVQRGPRGPYVFVVNEDNTVTRRTITVGHEDIRLAIITDGVKPGERVVIDGASRLNDGGKITIAPPPGQQPPGQQAPAATPQRPGGRPAAGAPTGRSG